MSSTPVYPDAQMPVHLPVRRRGRLRACAWRAEQERAVVGSLNASMDSCVVRKFLNVLMPTPRPAAIPACLSTSPAACLPPCVRLSRPSVPCVRARVRRPSSALLVAACLALPRGLVVRGSWRDAETLGERQRDTQAAPGAASARGRGQPTSASREPFVRGRAVADRDRAREQPTAPAVAPERCVVGREASEGRADGRESLAGLWCAHRDAGGQVDGQAG